MSTQTGLHYNQPCPCSVECHNVKAAPARNISEEHWSEIEAKKNRYCMPCRKAACYREGKHVPDQSRQDSV